MLFLMNDAVLNLQSIKLSPQMAGRKFQALSREAVRRLGQELYAEDPQLHVNRPERAKRLATLIVSTAPSINAALFLSPAPSCRPAEVDVRFASVSQEVVAQLYRRQEQGLLDVVGADAQVWRRLAA